jgi:hypothetical protein
MSQNDRILRVHRRREHMALRVRAALILLLAMNAVPASANGIDLWEFLSELSGPGPFKGWTVHGRLMCLGRGSDLARVRESAMLEERRKGNQNFAGPPSVPPLDAARVGRANGDVAYTAWMLPFEDAFRNSSNLEIARADHTSARFSRLVCWADRGVRSHVNAYYRRLSSTRNTLAPQPSSQLQTDSADAEFGKVVIHDAGIEYAVRLDGMVDVGTRIGLATFKGPAFETFQRLSFDYINVRIYPGAAWADSASHRVFAIFFAASGFKGGFDQSDFCNKGCREVRPFAAPREVQFRVGLEVDPSSIVRSMFRYR